MMDFDDFGGAVAEKPLSQAEKAAAVLLAMGKEVAGRLLKYFTQHELQLIISSAQSLRPIPPDELAILVAEFEDLFTEGAGLMDNAKAIESILEEGLTPDEVDSLLGRRTAFQAFETSIWDRLGEGEPAFVGSFLLKEHPQTIAYILSMMPSSFGAKVLMQIPDAQRADIMNRTVNLKDVSPKAAQIIENRVVALLAEIEMERNAGGSAKVAELMNEMEKPQVDTLLSSLETLSQASVDKVRPKIFLFDDLMLMPQRGRVLLLNDISADILTMALRGSSSEMRETVLASISPRQRRMIESDLAAGTNGINPREIAIARRAIAQEAIRLANSGQIQLKEPVVADTEAA
ncbi:MULTISPECIES: flagellar motor switch protein FliG [unclassified Rhizobium]|uniref:flagellar motor switch protein FliG n=1 Tax=unclassified Rhizobium TaxID=2613769 RepID=UPI001AD9EB3E|nr:MULTISPECIES: flagellar motor switch protein FliG [unclassified Rhizobium]MBO9097263.1 flagellar motor switch protein FliG [Rhizobium sp. L58/93]MBO9133885.1 flagellar motor switch protein FliG [Rhizobium sp. B209b/85]MBO9167502.1 flagellar motor switch protein FliG [Rhizobium sp. L245/93]MBO9183461.1 flagellar motor switch protein FliG [Rhizobium sp. E27B/91]QXZ83795.1 flagellar motor switch protein FliG [Rhizobium sp. K1/93]